MGAIKEIDFDKYPEQGSWINKKVKVCYHYDASKLHEGVIVRDDRTDPFVTLIHLPSERRFLLATECQYQLAE